MAADRDCARLSLSFSGLPLAAVFTEAFRLGWRHTSTAIAEPDAMAALQADADGRGDRRAGESGVRRRRRVGHRQISVSRQAAAHHADRSAVRGVAGHFGNGVRPAVRPAGIPRPVADRTRHPHRVRDSRDRARDDLRVVSVRGARDHSGDGSDGLAGRGGGARARRRRIPDVLSRDAAEHQMGPALRRHPLQRPRDGRVRRGVGRLGAHPRADEHAAAARRDPLQRISVPGGVRGGVDSRVSRARHAGAEDASWNTARGDPMEPVDRGTSAETAWA